MSISSKIHRYRFDKKRENCIKNEESFFPSINANAETEYKKFLHSQVVLSLVEEISLEKKSLNSISVLEGLVSIEFEDRTKKIIRFSDKGLPPLGYIKLGSGFFETGRILKSYTSVYPYLTFCHVCMDTFDDDMTFSGMYFNQRKAVAYILATKLGMPFEDSGHGISDSLSRKNTPTSLKSWY